MRLVGKVPCYIAVVLIFANANLLTTLHGQTGARVEGSSNAEPKQELSVREQGKKIDDESLAAIINEVSLEHQITGMVAMVIVDHKTVAQAATGLRNAKQKNIPLTIDDKMHLGSCTKAITATLAGLLVDQGKLAWDDTIEDRLPQIADSIAVDYRTVTLAQLLQHRGGVIPNGAAWQGGGVGTFENRLVIIGQGLEKLPDGMEIGKFVYSNLGYAIAGAMIESAADSDYEELVRSMICEPLEMHSAGFGPPTGDKPFDQPWGHANRNGKVIPLKFDNPPSMSPAGRAHANLADWARFIAVHMQVDLNDESGFLSKETLEILHSPPKDDNPRPFDRPYAGGWAVVNAQTDALELQHEGSNTFWLATVIVQPHKGNAILVATNHPMDLSLKANSQVVDRVRTAIK